MRSGRGWGQSSAEGSGRGERGRQDAGEESRADGLVTVPDTNLDARKSNVTRGVALVPDREETSDELEAIHHPDLVIMRKCRDLDEQRAALTVEAEAKLVGARRRGNHLKCPDLTDAPLGVGVDVPQIE